MTEKSCVEIQFYVALTSVVYPRSKVVYRNSVSVAAGIVRNIACVKIKSFYTRNKLKRKVYSLGKFFEIAGATGIRTGCLYSAARSSRTGLESVNVVALPALQRNRDG